MFRKKKKVLGIPVTRTLQEINNDYNQHAAQAGHKSRLITRHQIEIDRLETEVRQHFEAMNGHARDAEALPKEEKPVEPPQAVSA